MLKKSKPSPQIATRLLFTFYLISFLLSSPLSAQPATHNLTLTSEGNGTIVRDPVGTDCGADCFNYPENTIVTLTAAPNAESIFQYWTGETCASTSTQIEILLTSTQTCTAHFELLPPSRLQLSQPHYFVNEISGKAMVLVTRAASNLGEISVDYATADATALAGDDYQSVTGTLTWATGDFNYQMIEIPILSNGFTTENKTLTVTLFNPTGGALLGKNQQAVVEIIDTPATGAGSLQFSAANYAIVEESGSASITVERIGGDIGAVAVDYLTTDGSALAGSDYQATQGTLNWINGDALSKAIKLSISIDAEAETEETFTVNLTNPTGGANLGANARATIKILDELGTSTTPSAGILQFTTPTVQVAENAGNVTLSVSRTQGSQGQVSVNYNTQTNSTQTAQAGSDYTHTTGTLTWASDEAQNQNITIPVLADSSAESNETFSVNLSAPMGQASLGANATATVTILDSLGTPNTSTPPAPSAGLVQFVADNYQIDEGGDNLTITVSRTQGSQGVVEVTYATEPGTAGQRDYQAIQGTFRWLDGESDEKSFTLSSYDDGLIEDEEQFLLILTDLTGGAKLGSNDQAIVNIRDNDATFIQLNSDSYVIEEDSQSVTLLASRRGGRVGQISVNYETSIPCTSTTTPCATAGEDFIATKGLLTWISGDLSNKKITIPLRGDRQVEGNEVISVKLSNLVGNANFGTPSEATVTLIDNDPGECIISNAQADIIIDCYWDNTGNTLENITITELGTLIGGKLGGENENQGIIQNVTLLANTLIRGGQSGGIIRGDIRTESSNDRAVLSYLTIAAGSTLANIVVGRGTQLASDVTLNKGVVFEYNNSIPYRANLETLLGKISTPYLEVDAIKLTTDVLLYNSQGGIVSAINGLPEFFNLNAALSQNPTNGYLELDIESVHYAVLPIQVHQAWGKQTINNEPLPATGVHVQPNGEITFITHSGREIVTLPVVQAPQILRQSLAQLGLPNLIMQSNGNLKIPTAEGGYYFARPNNYALEAPLTLPLGLDGTNSPWLKNLSEIFLVFEVGSSLSATAQPRRRQQMLYPAAADPLAFEALSEQSDSQTLVYIDGRVYAYTGIGAEKKPYKGILDYQVLPGTPSGQTKVQFIDIEDVNQDGFTDYRVIYPNGDNQIMYQCDACFK
jgi:hypothetical protein